MENRVVRIALALLLSGCATHNARSSQLATENRHELTIKLRCERFSPDAQSSLSDYGFEVVFQQVGKRIKDINISNHRSGRWVGRYDGKSFILIQKGGEEGMITLNEISSDKFAMSYSASKIFGPGKPPSETVIADDSFQGECRAG